MSKDSLAGHMMNISVVFLEGGRRRGGAQALVHQTDEGTHGQEGRRGEAGVGSFFFRARGWEEYASWIPGDGVFRIDIICIFGFMSGYYNFQANCSVSHASRADSQWCHFIKE